MARRQQEIYEFRDLSEEQHGTYVVIGKKVPKNPTTLNESSWVCECQECGARRNIGGHLLVEETFKVCPCQKREPKLRKGETQVGLGLYHMMSQDKEAFHAYIKRREQESKKNFRQQPFIPNKNETSEKTNKEQQ